MKTMRKLERSGERKRDAQDRNNSVADLKNNNPMGNWILGKDSGTINRCY